MVTFIDAHRDTHGVEPIGAMLPIAPSTYFLHKAQQRDATQRSARAQRDDELRAEFQRVWDANEQVYGPRKVWRQLRREKCAVARCRVERLMRAMGLRGVVRGRAWKVTTQADPAGARPTDLVDRQFTAIRPNQLWVADFTYMATWRGTRRRRERGWPCRGCWPRRCSSRPSLRPRGGPPWRSSRRRHPYRN
jgi:putative transposase